MRSISLPRALATPLFSRNTGQNAQRRAQSHLLCSAEGLEARLAAEHDSHRHAGHPDAVGNNHRLEERHDRVPGESGDQCLDPDPVRYLPLEQRAIQLERYTGGYVYPRLPRRIVAAPWSRKSPRRSIRTASPPLPSVPTSSPSPWLRACRLSLRSLMSWSSPIPAHPPQRPSPSKLPRSARTQSVSLPTEESRTRAGSTDHPGSSRLPQC